MPPGTAPEGGSLLDDTPEDLSQPAPGQRAKPAVVDVSPVRELPASTPRLFYTGATPTASLEGNIILSRTMPSHVGRGCACGFDKSGLTLFDDNLRQV
jgi:hypothetical protein